jgi:hypothetical protein
MKLKSSRQIFRNRKLKNQISSNSSSGSRVVPCGRTDGQRDMTKLIAYKPRQQAVQLVFKLPQRSECYFLAFGFPTVCEGLADDDVSKHF